MPYNNFSNGYKKVLLQTEENIRNLWLKYLSVEDIFLSIVFPVFAHGIYLKNSGKNFNSMEEYSLLSFL